MSFELEHKEGYERAQIIINGITVSIEELTSSYILSIAEEAVALKFIFTEKY